MRRLAAAACLSIAATALAAPARRDPARMSYADFSDGIQVTPARPYILISTQGSFEPKTANAASDAWIEAVIVRSDRRVVYKLRVSMAYAGVQRSFDAATVTAGSWSADAPVALLLHGSICGKEKPCFRDSVGIELTGDRLRSIAAGDAPLKIRVHDDTGQWTEQLLYPLEIKALIDAVDVNLATL